MLAYSLVSPALQRPVTNAPVRWFADISYSVYLIHLAVIWVAINEFSLPRAPGSSAVVATLVWFALTIVVSTVYAYLSARYLERPIRRWARSFRPAPRSALAKGAPDRVA
jgi:peptidoglycan/LPS O-acetylase OafA/YrhL